MIFDTEYSHALDRDYKGHSTDAKPLAELSIKNIGISAPPMSDQLQALKSRIYQGASKVELGFTGSGKGSMSGQRTTPGMYSSEDRQAMRELADFNEINLTTHASFSIPPLSGLNMQQGEFSDQQRESTLHEIERAIDFAADTARGGAIVVHTGEFPRAISDSFKGEGFKGYPGEDKQGTKYMVDDRTGKFVSSIRKDQIQYEPLYKTAESEGKVGTTDKEGHVFKKEDWIDINGNWINPKKTKDLFNRVPEWNEDETNFKTVARNWDYYVKKSKEWNEEHSNGKIRTPEEMWIRTQVENQILQARGSSLFHAQRYEEHRETRDAAMQALEFYEQLEKGMPEEEKWKLLRQKQFDYGRLQGLVPPKDMMPSDFLRSVIKDHENNMRYIHESSAAADAQAATQLEMLNNLKTVEDYGTEKAADTIARAAQFAYVKTKELEKRGELKKPLFVSPENIDPHMFGGHPQELKKLIIQSRAAFVEQNKQRFGESKAKELANTHIKATFDVGHANVWRKFYEGDPRKSIAENDKMFKKWVIDQVKDLNKSNIIGHIHVSDNFGWDDEHVTPGFGKAPIKEFIDEMAKAGIKDVIVEPGHQDYKALLGGWREFGSSIYGGAVVSPSSRWGNIEHSYFGQTRRPYFIFGDYAPSGDFTLWSQVPLE